MTDDFKSFYKDGLVPNKEYHETSKEVSGLLESVFQKYISLGYSPREISELLHAITSFIASEKALLLTVKRKKTSLTKNSDSV